jgi:hypothetical protein
MYSEHAHHVDGDERVEGERMPNVTDVTGTFRACHHLEQTALRITRDELLPLAGA